MKIGMYISELLYDHDAVVLPGFGEFFTKYTPARFIPEEGKVESPKKTIAFNPDKTEGDDPLVSYLGEQQGLDSEQVKAYLANFVSEIKQIIDSGKKVELERVGLFSKDESGSMLFEPDQTVNYLNIPTEKVPEPPRKTPEPETAIAAGRMPVASHEREASGPDKTEPPIQTEPKDREVIIMEKEKKAELPRALRWVAFTVVPILIILIILAINYEFFFGLFKGERTRTTEVELVAPDAAPDQTGIEETEDPVTGANDVTAADVTEPQPGVAEPADAARAAEPVTPGRGQTIYYIVVGSFPDQEKAEQLASSLRDQGATMANVFMTTGFNYHRVSYGHYTNLEEAERVLEHVKENVNQEAWILHR